MRLATIAAGVWWVAVGCGGQGATGSGGAAGTNAAHGGAGGAAGESGAGGRGAGAMGGGLPACAITTRPVDPTDAGISSLGGTCNTIVVTTTGVDGQKIDSIDGGVLVPDGGAIITPAGGAILDGDYDFVRWQNIGGGGLSYRTLRVFGGGTYIEWAFHQMDSTYDGGFQNLKFDTIVTLAAYTMTFTYPCGGDLGIADFNYTAVGNDLLLFDTRGPDNTVDSVDTYQRTCAR